MSFIYVIQSGRDILKIGKADDVRKRLRTLQTAQPYPLRVLHRIEVSSGDVMRLEREIHRRLKGFRLEGEWFCISPAKAIAVVERCSELLRRHKARLRESEDALVQHPGTIMRHLYCPRCFHRGKAHMPLGTVPKYRCSKCGERPLIGGIDQIKPWWKARKAYAVVEPVSAL